MSDGSRLRQSWYEALGDAETHFRQLLSSSNWKRLSSDHPKWKSLPDRSNVVVHRSDDVLRLILDLPAQSGGLEPWKAILSTPELRQEWDPAVEEAHLLELIDPHVRICKTKFTLGWPANPRDAVTISRMYHDSNTLIDIATSLPRSLDEPTYLRPSPPYVRSHVALFAWCIQRLRTDSLSPKLRITCFWQHDLKSLWSFSLTSPALHQQLSTMILGLFKAVLKRGTRVPCPSSFGDCIALDHVKYQVDRQALTVNYALVPPEGDHEHKMNWASSVVEYILPSSEGWDIQLSTKASSDEVKKLQWVAQALKKNTATNSEGGFDIVLLRITHEPLRGDNEVLKVRLIIEVSSASRGIRLNGVLQRVEDEEDQNKDQDRVKEGEEEMLRDVESVTGVSIVTSSSAATGKSAYSMTSSGSGTTAIAGSSSFGAGVNIGLGGPGERTLAAEKSVLSRVRRTYIYFSSLLQEPEAKWRQVMDTRGVSITQLDSIDPTLLVYRAEATFVGVGLWDLYGAVLSAGTKGYWDKSHDDAVLLEDVNGLTELWHIKAKPGWAVNGRDAVLLKTVYKSPTSIHVFAFSADSDPHLFPNNLVPPVDPNMIRTQIDLQGWAIESLSPTTTLLTLLEQSDMKGWTGKTSMPSQMTAHLAGIGEFAIKCGGPPVVTRLSGAKKIEEKFDWEKASFRVVYQPLKPSAIRSTSVAASISTGSASESAAGNSLPAGQQQGSEPVVTASENEMIECEIRCDVDTWAASLDIVVDPPPQGISCLRRHKLSAEGGGLWLTLTHDPVYLPISSNFLCRRKRIIKTSIGSLSELQTAKPSLTVGDNEDEEDGKFRVIVRRAPGKEKGLVMVNGRRVNVDVEEMSESEVKSAMRQKRVKPPRVPLDQPPVVGVVRMRREEWGDEAGGEGQPASGSGDTDTKRAVRSPSTSRERTEVMLATREWASAPKAGSLSRWWSYAVEVASSTVVPVSNASILGGRMESAMPSRQKWPMQYALEALEWVMEEYAEDRLGAGLVSSAGLRSNGANRTVADESVASSSSASGTTPDGWSIVGEKAGLGVYRKLISEVSPIVPVHRGTKIIEGVSAEELAGAILHDSCRKEWDDRFDSSRVFESFGWGCETGFTVLKGGFPFRDRGLYLAKVVARPAPTGITNTRMGRSRSMASGSIRGPGMLMKTSAGLGDPGTNGRRNSGAYPGAIFIVSASYSGESDSISRFSADKYNEYTLPIGRSFVDAWVLETLDPYDTRETDVTIPSTRCTRVVAVDLRGSAPTAINGMVNVTMVRALSALGDWVTKRMRGKQEVEGGKASDSATTVKDAPAALGIVAPSMRIPGGSILLREARGDMEGLDRKGVAWSVRMRDEKRVLVKETFAVGKRVYRCAMLVSVWSVLGGGKEKEEKCAGRTSDRPKSPRSPSPQRTDEGERSLPRENDFAEHKDNAGGRMPSGPSGTVRGRAATLSYSQHRGLRSPTDLLVAELVIDSKMYSNGYDITVCFRKRSEEKLVMGGAKGDVKCIPLRDTVVKTTDATNAQTSSALAPSSLLDVVANASAPADTSTNADNIDMAEIGDAPDARVLPFGYTVHTMPSSPMHSSGLAAESPMRHLVRITLPTAQYQIQTVEDPLTGEVRTPPPKPAWLTEMEEGGSAVVEVEVRPKFDKASSPSRKGTVVRVNGRDVPVESEKESLTSLGREELMDDRLTKTPIFTMVPNEAEALPEMLTAPLAVADNLLNPAAMKAAALDNQESKPMEVTVTDPESNGEPAGTQAVEMAGVRAPTQANPGGLLGFLQGYPNPLTRFTGGSVPNGIGGHTTTGTGASSASNVLSTCTAPAPGSSSEKVPGGLGDLNRTATTTPRMYPVSIVVIVALIAFLIGSLLRSLLSPADFIYVVQDIKGAEEAAFVGGWREIRRLFEVKYVLGGWDFQIAAVRRH
ncbi:hypothetical protein AX15_000823 [Amanita polypyramis BW_CC]|nr:hypothetical protein AX15_000823 [Amanita polypyramis BW_CC]